MVGKKPAEVVGAKPTTLCIEEELGPDGDRSKAARRGGANQHLEGRCLDAAPAQSQRVLSAEHLMGLP